MRQLPGVLIDPKGSSSKSYADASRDETKKPLGAYYITSVSYGGKGK